MDLDYRVPTPTIQESATSLWRLGFLSLWFRFTYRTKVQGPPYKGGRVPGLTTCTESHLDTESYSRSCPSKLELRVMLGLFFWRVPSPHGPWSACLQPSPCDLMRDSACGLLGLGGSTFRVHGPTYKVSPHHHTLATSSVKLQAKSICTETK